MVKTGRDGKNKVIDKTQKNDIIVDVIGIHQVAQNMDRVKFC